MKTALLIPCYQPKENAHPFLLSFAGDEFDHFLLVDDGSGKEYASFFEEIGEKAPFEILSYPRNKGKGGALKTGIRHIIENHLDVDIIVTADSDGQHTYKDILEVRDTALENPHALIMGVRDFSKADIPPKSKVGNVASAIRYKLMTGHSLIDTQTGLRAIPKEMFPLSLAIEGIRYDYEFNFLIEATHLYEIKSKEIEIVYENNNEGTHFRPIRDSIRVFKPSILEALLKLSYVGLDILAFFLFTLAFSNLTKERFPLSILSSLPSLFLVTIPYGLGIGFLSTPSKTRRQMRGFQHGFVALIALFFSTLFTALFSLPFENLVLIRAIVDVLIFFLASIIRRIYIVIHAKRHPQGTVLS